MQIDKAEVIKTIELARLALALEIVQKTDFFVPEELALQAVMVKAWKPVYRKLRGIVSEFVDFKAKMPIGHMTMGAFDDPELHEMNKEAVALMVEKGRKYIENSYVKAWKVGDSREARETRKADAIYGDNFDRLMDVITGHMGSYANNHLMQQAAPEIMRLVNWMKDNEATRLADMVTVTNRIDRMMASDDYWGVLSNMHTSRAYQFGAIEFFNEHQIEKYQINEVMDTRICRICLRMHGKVFTTVSAMRKIERYRDAMNQPDIVRELFPFPDGEVLDRLAPQLEEIGREAGVGIPELSEVDNQTPDALRNSAFTMPPFHVGCRGVVVAFQQTITTSEPESKETPNVSDPVKATITDPMKLSYLDDVASMKAKVHPVYGLNNLYNLAEEQGFTGKPVVVSTEDFDILAKANPKNVIFRGVSDKRYLSEFIKGDYHPGVGIYGGGEYWGAGENALIKAKQFAPMGDESFIQKAIINPKANIVPYNTIAVEQKEFLAKIEKDLEDIWDKVDEGLLDRKAAKLEMARLQAAKDLASDTGQYAVMRGYDAIYIQTSDSTVGYRSLSVDVGSDELILLNRTAAIVTKI